MPSKGSGRRRELAYAFGGCRFRYWRTSPFDAGDFITRNTLEGSNPFANENKKPGTSSPLVSLFARISKSRALLLYVRVGVDLRRWKWPAGDRVVVNLAGSGSRVRPLWKEIHIVELLVSAEISKAVPVEEEIAASLVAQLSHECIASEGHRSLKPCRAARVHERQRRRCRALSLGDDVGGLEARGYPHAHVGGE